LMLGQLLLLSSAISAVVKPGECQHVEDQQWATNGYRNSLALSGY
jgi:hypothetical protein